MEVATFSSSCPPAITYSVHVPPLPFPLPHTSDVFMICQCSHSMTQPGGALSLKAGLEKSLESVGRKKARVRERKDEDWRIKFWLRWGVFVATVSHSIATYFVALLQRT